MQSQTIIEVLKTAFSGLIVISLVIAFFQVRAALRISKANALLRLIQEWNSRELYEAVRYIHILRIQWKHLEPDHRQWSRLAQTWVAEHANARSDSNEPEEKKRADEWNKRRDVSQFISKMGYLMQNSYISRDDFFGVVAEAKRLLVVLIPIENCIAKYFQTEDPIGEWDKPFNKIAFNEVTKQYDRWFEKKGKELLLPANPV